MKKYNNAMEYKPHENVLPQLALFRAQNSNGPQQQYYNPYFYLHKHRISFHFKASLKQ